ncbi:MAG TPA: 30S ribosome-binding factor RbfA [Pirellulales bacterium]|jgi:ribosome-binding factor A|nr:30S ribosome-binding factor RbfA [Pirellulales bacterium]
MSGRRVQKVAEAIREVVSMAILTELRDPRVRDVTVTYVEVSADLRIAKVHVSIMGDDKKQQLALRGLQHAAGFFQSKVGDRVQMRFTPQIQFYIDLGVKRSIEIARILREVLPPTAGPLAPSVEPDDSAEYDSLADKFVDEDENPAAAPRPGPREDETE